MSGEECGKAVVQAQRLRIFSGCLNEVGVIGHAILGRFGGREIKRLRVQQATGHVIGSETHDSRRVAECRVDPAGGELRLYEQATPVEIVAAPSEHLLEGFDGFHRPGSAKQNDGSQG